MDNWLELSNDIAAQVAKSVHSKYHTYFDVADVRQELMMWVVRREDKVKDWLSQENGEKLLGKTLSRQADKYCRRRKAKRSGYQLEDEAFYSPISLAELLPFAWDEVVESRDATKPRVSGGGNPAEGGTYIVQLIDVRRGLMKLDPADKMILQMKFYDQMPYSDIAAALEVSDTTANRRVEGAIRRLNRILGGLSPFTKEELE